ncbi:glycerophosphodiester phosphodiesterase [Acinetobacter sp. 187]|uniref:glycerophosphodiester phosphodiesterase n=1 Tax=Acinetobacter lanii TaxID=2715163 RepID=UPI00140E4B4B|nr:glycerophosphodiester phosphodiesterase [Acinetobacter lanii]NHC03498.1 glycerophosphodiester phosphodiesterase [Acinetobacter lanii]
MRIIGHRGARGEAPENTLGGFRYIQDVGIRAVEFDVRQLKDDQLIIMHDDQFLRTTGQSHDLYACSTADLQAFDQAYIWQDWTDFEITPSLQDSLQLMKNFEHIEVEVKAVDSLDEAQHLVEHLQQALIGFSNSAVITSFDLKIHQALQQQQSTFKRGLLIEDEVGHQAIDQALELNCCQIGWKNSLATEQLIKDTLEQGLNVSVWTVNEIERAKQLRDLGIQGLITDFPKMMLQHL